MALTPRTAGACGRTILKLSEAIDQLEGHILIPTDEHQMMDAAKAVLDRAFDEVMIMFAHLNNGVLKDEQARWKAATQMAVRVGEDDPTIITRTIPF